MLAQGSRKDSSPAKERRSGEGGRVQFEAMVAVGGVDGGGAFEAESVNVSLDGMRLKTAYLPQIGDELVCRFEGPDGEVIAIGKVTWATEGKRGGEFGLQFVDVDEETRTALSALAKSDETTEGDEAVAAIAKGSRVRLHIDGLASPMKARVRDADQRVAAVGSSLEFLKLGRPVEIEDVEAGERRQGFVDTVKVEVDPTSSVPQLVVSLRFDALAAQPSNGALGTRTSKRPSEPPPSASKKLEAAAEEASSEDGQDEVGPSRVRAAEEKVKAMTEKAASQLGPALSRMGEGAKGFLSRLSSSVTDRKTRASGKAGHTKRVTAPPPGGALKADGKRVVREETDADLEAIQKPKKKTAVLGVAALGLVLGALGLSHALTKDEAPIASVSSADARREVRDPLPLPGAAATAGVPLYGQTPLSTTEQIELPAPAVSGKAIAEGDSEEGSEPDAEASDLLREWGNGEFKGQGKKLVISLEGPVQGFSGEETDEGFILKVPSQKSKSTQSSLARKDKRLAAVDVVNKEEGAEISVRFKGDVPTFKARAKGDRIEILLAADETKKSEPKKVAAKKSTSSKKPAAKKKK